MSDDRKNLDRRSFTGGVLGATPGIGAAALLADEPKAQQPAAPRSANAREGEGYLMGVATRNDENDRADLVILDAEHIADGPVATVKLPMRVVGQVHGWWVPEAQLPAAS
ncbi:carotenoid oxygenase family protein [Candidatus Rariloculus sp.]|uniref:carotenoid oxygenase family protein n=1 Tax=Candidatus Rariloculus sp. TaxID=3101265 RepID=UPI003D0D2A82